MARTLNTTVHLVDDKGEAHTFGPSDKLPRWAETKLKESWPADRDDLWEAGEPEPEPEEAAADEKPAGPAPKVPSK